MEASTNYIETSVAELSKLTSLADNVKKEKITKVHDIDEKADRVTVWEAAHRSTLALGSTVE